uniref:TIL domain-containing protein n=1 Tax=Rhabditophanes sp. KR3021 TaxID=114890 RepID=A0AC35TKB2_9BILA
MEPAATNVCPVAYKFVSKLMNHPPKLFKIILKCCNLAIDSVLQDACLRVTKAVSKISSLNNQAVRNIADQVACLHVQIGLLFNKEPVNKSASVCRIVEIIVAPIKIAIQVVIRHVKISVANSNALQHACHFANMNVLIKWSFKFLSRKELVTLRACPNVKRYVSEIRVTRHVTHIAKLSVDQIKTASKDVAILVNVKIMHHLLLSLILVVVVNRNAYTCVQYVSALELKVNQNNCGIPQCPRCEQSCIDRYRPPTCIAQCRPACAAQCIQAYTGMNVEIQEPLRIPCNTVPCTCLPGYSQCGPSECCLMYKNMAKKYKAKKPASPISQNDENVNSRTLPKAFKDPTQRTSTSTKVKRKSNKTVTKKSANNINSKKTTTAIQSSIEDKKEDSGIKGEN